MAEMERGAPKVQTVVGENGAAAPLPSDAIALIPVREMTLFPGVVMPITLGRERSIAAAQLAVREQRQIGVLMQRDREVVEPSAIDMHRIGTIANVVRYMTGPDGSHHLVCQGDERFQAVEFLSGWPFLVARIKRIPEPEAKSAEIEARHVNLQRQTIEALELLPQAPAELIVAVQSVRSPGALADLATAYMDLKPEEKQEILETIDVSARMDKVSKLLAHRIEVLRLSQEIGRQTKVCARRAPARGAAARADGGDPAPARRGRGGQGRRDRRARRGDRQGRHAEGGRGAGAQGAAPARAHARGPPNTA